ncbi:hypothetical protein FGAF344_43300 [Escherichia coli]|nr:hypothetical protein FGAF344_43300 [Escherichia coli]
MLGGADNPNGELLSYIIGADTAFYLVFRTHPVRDTKARHRISAILLT